MKHSLQNIMMFAVAQDSRIVHIDEVANGCKCECLCPACHTPLIAKNEGSERTHHFAHDGRMEQHSCSETALHFAAKQIVADNKKILLPEAPIWGDGGGKIIEFVDVILEHRIDADIEDGKHIVADCLGIYGIETLIIEIAVHHEVDLVKLKKIQSMNISAIEISLADFANKHWDWESLAQEVLFSNQRRKWLWHAEIFSHEVKNEKEADVPHIGDDIKKEWVFDIGGHWVWVKKLPYSNIKIFHRPSAYARSVVEPLCRNRGYWSPKYKCWIVFDQYKDYILKSLSEVGRLSVA